VSSTVVAGAALGRRVVDGLSEGDELGHELDVRPVSQSEAICETVCLLLIRKGHGRGDFGGGRCGGHAGDEVKEMDVEERKREGGVLASSSSSAVGHLPPDADDHPLLLSGITASPCE
jgi:hypothetical protein